VETTKYPIQTDHLVKGSIIPAQTIERAFNVQRGTDAYQLAAMRAGKYIEDSFEDRGELVTVVQRRHDLVVLTDDEAVGHNARQFRVGIRKAARSHRRALAVDRAQISPVRLQEHDRNLEVNGRILSAIRTAKREILPSPRPRETPLRLRSG